jgi:hypothetical protein
MAIQEFDVGPDIWMYMSPLPEDAVCAGTLTAYVIPPSAMLTDWPYASEPGLTH